MLPIVLYVYIKGNMEAKDVWKQNPEANIWAEEGLEMGSGEGSIMRKFIACIVRLI